MQQISAKEYKTRYDWVEKVIHWELCKKLKFDHTNKWYIKNPESILDNETQTSQEFCDTNRSPNLGQTIKKPKKHSKHQKSKIKTEPAELLTLASSE